MFCCREQDSISAADAPASLAQGFRGSSEFTSSRTHLGSVACLDTLLCLALDAESPEGERQEVLGLQV